MRSCAMPSYGRLDERDVYRKLAKHLASLGMGYPEKEKLLEILRENFTPLEAEVALAIPTKVIPFEACSGGCRYEPPDRVSREELKRILVQPGPERASLFQKT